ncbi:hypothetical protein BGZ83_009876 [Gryganskiella cystojenkinii]|nr:hypothetical protein BGZ83_009876 [Gryganskiella cystojenkinii]
MDSTPQASRKQPLQPQQQQQQQPRMQRFTRPEDLAMIEGLDTQTSRTHDPERVRELELDRTRQYLEAHTTFLNSADPTGGPGFIPSASTTASYYHHLQQPPPARQSQAHHHPHHPQAQFYHVQGPLSSSSSATTPPNYPSSLAGDDSTGPPSSTGLHPGGGGLLGGGLTAPGTPHSFLSSPSIGYYSYTNSHNAYSRPSSRIGGYWVDPEAEDDADDENHVEGMMVGSTMHLIMPSSAMFVKTREPTVEGEQLGFVRMLVAGQSRVWNARLIQEMFKWDSILANDFDDEFLQESHDHLQQPSSSSSPTLGVHLPPAAAGTTTTNAAIPTQSSDGSNKVIEEGYFYDSSSSGQPDQPAQLSGHRGQGSGSGESTGQGPNIINTNQRGRRSRVSSNSAHVAQESGSSATSSRPTHNDLQQQQQQKRSSRRNRCDAVTEAIIEHYASSMILPTWAREGLDEQEMHQEILVKNICIVDTPGCDAFTNSNRAMDLTISYLGLQFQTSNEFFSRSARSDDALGRFLANNATGAHSHVDACLYVVHGQLTEVDVQFLHRLQPWVNIIPVLVPQSLAGQNPEKSSSSTNSGGSTVMDTHTARVNLIRKLRENDIVVYGVEEIPPPSTAVSPEDESSPPPLSLDTALLRAEYCAPPFVFSVPEDGATGYSDMDIQQLQVQQTGSKSLEGFEEKLAAPAQQLCHDLEPLRQWVYVDRLSALRHHTILKFLAWRRDHYPSSLATLSSPALMYSSQESVSFSTRQRVHSYNQHQQDGAVTVFPPYVTDYYPPTDPSRATLSATTNSPPPSIRTHATLPSDLLRELSLQEQLRLAAKVQRLLETSGQVFERIMMERKESWQRALGGLEREQRIQFLIQELKRWAYHEQPTSSVLFAASTDPRSGVEFGLGRQGSHGHNPLSTSLSTEPSLMDAVHEPAIGSHSKSAITTAAVMESGRRSTGRPKTIKKSRHIQKKSETASLLSYEEQQDEEDPLGLGRWMGRLLRTMGRGLAHAVVMMSMGNLAAWIYTHFLEHSLLTWPL